MKQNEDGLVICVGITLTGSGIDEKRVYGILHNSSILELPTTYRPYRSLEVGDS
ncbi:hypothetical protein ACQCVP_21995 [Rossellomorea vietnamensis]